MYGDDELLALSGLQHIAYCERQWALIHIEQVWSENRDTVRGELFHARVDMVGYACSSGIRAERRVHVVSHRLGIYGIADIVERPMDGGGSVLPVEYKVGKPKIEDWDRVQVAAQAMCLEEMEGVRVDTGALFYGETHRREQVDVTDDLRFRVEMLAERMHRLFESGGTPRARRSAKCRRCSISDICLPQIFEHDVRSYWDACERGGCV